MPTSPNLSQIQAHLQQRQLLPFGNMRLDRQRFLKQLTQQLSKKSQAVQNFDKDWTSVKNYGPDRQTLVVDLGGTFLRFYLVNITSNRLRVVKQQKYDFYQKVIYTPQLLFGQISKLLFEFMGAEKAAELEKIILIFSFPLQPVIRPNGLFDGICLNFSKAHQSRNMIGLHVGSFFENHLRQKGFPLVQVTVTNDAAPGLLAAKEIEINQHQKPFDVVINLIVGTGTNLAIGYNSKGRFHLFNTEVGQFNFFSSSWYDRQLLKTLPLPRQYATEKLYSGKWRQAIFHFIVKDLVAAKLLSADLAKHVSADASSADLDDLLLNSKINQHHQLYVFRFIWELLAIRGGEICGRFLAWTIDHLAQKLNLEPINVGIVLTGGVIDHSKPLYNTLLSKLQQEIESSLCRKRNSHTYIYNLLKPEEQTVFGAIIFDLFSQGF